MIIYLDEDPSYLSWVTHHRHGFVLATSRLPRSGTLHRANCSQVRAHRTSHRHFTTGKQQKACAIDIDQLTAWFSEHATGKLNYCPDCNPGERQSPEQLTPPDQHLTKLGREVLSYVLEIAIVSLDDQEVPYSLTFEELAKAFGKSVHQFDPTITALIDSGWITVTPAKIVGQTVEPRAVVIPTAWALRREPAFQSLNEKEISCELKKLTSDQP